MNDIYNYTDLFSKYKSIDAFLSEYTDKIPLIQLNEERQQIMFDAEYGISFGRLMEIITNNDLKNGVVYFGSNISINKVFTTPIVITLQGIITRSPMCSAASPDYVYIHLVDYDHIEFMDFEHLPSPQILLTGEEEQLSLSETNEISVVNTLLERLFNKVVKANDDEFEEVASTCIEVI